MKRTLLICLSLGYLAFPAWCQPNATNTNTTAPPPAPKAPKVPTIFDFKKEIDMSPEQEAKMRALLDELRNNMAAGEKHLGVLEQEYRKFLEKEPTVDQARAKLQEIANSTVELRCIDLQTSRRIIAVLRPEQLQKWKDIQARLKTAPK